MKDTEGASCNCQRRSRSLTFENVKIQNNLCQLLSPGVILFFILLIAKRTTQGLKKDYFSDSKAGGALASTLDNTPYLDLAIEAER